MADDAMDVNAIEDDALNDDDEENGDECEEGYKMTKVSGYLHFSNEHRPEVTTRVNAMEGLAPRERTKKLLRSSARCGRPCLNKTARTGRSARPSSKEK